MRCGVSPCLLLGVPIWGHISSRPQRLCLLSETTWHERNQTTKQNRKVDDSLQVLDLEIP